MASAALLPLSYWIEPVLGAALAGWVRMAFVATAPGLAALALLWRFAAADPAATAFRALALSPLILAVLSFACAALGGGGVGGGASLAAPLLCALAVVAAAVPAARGEASPEPARWMIGPVLALVVLSLAMFTAPGVRLSYHGLLHAGFTAQLASGLVPPDNPALAGEPLGFYWMFHWLLAVWSRISGLSVLEASAALGLASLAAYTGLAARLCARVASPGWAALAVLVVPFAGNLLAPVLLATGTGFLERAPESFQWPFQFLTAARGPGDARAVTLLAKFWNVNGVPVALASWALLLDATAPGRLPRPALAFLATGSLVLFHPTTALAALVALAPALVVSTLADPPRRRFWDRLRPALPLAFALVAALAVTAPYLLSVAFQSNAIHASPIGRSGILRYNALGLLWNATPLWIALLLAPYALRRPVERFLWVTTLVLLAFAFLLGLPDNNQYKFLLAAALPGGALALSGLSGLAGRARPLAVGIGAAALGLGIASHGITAFAYRQSSMWNEPGYRGDGAYLRPRNEPDLEAALVWLRENTAPHAVVLVQPVGFGASPLAAVSGRRPYVLEGGHHTEGHPTYARRRPLAEALFGDALAPGPILSRVAEEIDAPLYLLEQPARRSGETGSPRGRFAAAPEILEQVFERGEVRVYRVRQRATRGSADRL